MKKLLILLIVSSLSLFATIDGQDENAVVKFLKADSNIPSKINDNIALTDLYIEPNKSTPKGGKEIVYEYTLNSTKAYDYEITKKNIEKGKKDICKNNKFMFGDKLNNTVVDKYKHLGKIVFQAKFDTNICR